MTVVAVYIEVELELRLGRGKRRGGKHEEHEPFYPWPIYPYTINRPANNTKSNVAIDTDCRQYTPVFTKVIGFEPSTACSPAGT
jgi:hypothetical protein